MKRYISGFAALIAGMALSIQPSNVAAQRPTQLPGEDRALAGSPQDVFSLGLEEGDPNEVFSTIASVGFDSRGNLFILDRDNRRIVMFDRSGAFVRTIGSSGQGPGEFTFPVGMAVYDDGRLAVMDLGNAGISVLDANGVYADIVSPDPGMVQPRPTLTLWPSMNNSILLAGAQVAPGGRSGPPQVSDSLPIIRVGLDGQSRVAHRVYNKGPEMAVSGSANAREIRISPPPAFSAQASFAALRDGGIAVSPGLQYEVRLVAPTGSVASVLTRPIRPRNVTERDRDLMRERVRETMESGAGQLSVSDDNGRRTFSAGGRGAPRQQIEQQIANMQFAEQVPVVRALTVDRAGNIWVQRDGGPGSEDYPIDIISAAAEYRGTVKGVALPDAFGPDGLAAFIEADDLGVQRVVVRRLPQGWR
jgi:hypothetical protein